MLMDDIEHPERLEMVGCIWNDPLGPYISFVKRESWGAAPAKEAEPLATPVTYIRFSHTGTDMTFYPRCQVELQEVQRDQMELGMSDISYNFMVGGDGTVYEGRGWKVEGDRPLEFASLKGKCLEIGYVGDFQEQQPPWLMLNVGVNLIKYGLKGKYIHPLFQVIQYNEKCLPEKI